MIQGMVNKLFDKPEVSQTTTGGTTSGAMPHMEGAQQMWQNYIDQGPTAYGGPIVGAHAPTAAMNQYTGSLGAMQNQYGGQGGIYDQATKRYGELAGFDPGKMQAGSFLQGPAMAQYLDRMGYDPNEQMALAEKRATKLGNLANIKNTASALSVGASGPASGREKAIATSMGANIGLGLEKELADRDRMARMNATQAMQTDVNRLTDANKFNIGNKYRTAGLQGDMLQRYQDISPRMNLASRFGDQGRYQDQLQMMGDQQRYGDFVRQQDFMPQALSGYTNFLGNPGWGSSSTSTQTGEGQSMFDKMLGVGMAGAGIYGMGGGFKGMF
jgi:hypothetical protein